MSKPILLIAGMGPGIGAAAAARFGAEGYQIAMIARKKSALDGFVGKLQERGIDAFGYQADVGDEGQLKQALAAIQAQLGTVDVLLYNAASFRRGKPLDLSVKDVTSDFAVNVLGALVCVQALAPAMVSKGKGSLLLTGGGLGLTPMAGMFALSFSKAALRNLTMSLAQELEPRGIRVGTVTVCGLVKPGTFFDPGKIADAFWHLHSQMPGQPNEVTIREG